MVFQVTASWKKNTPIREVQSEVQSHQESRHGEEHGVDDSPEIDMRPVGGLAKNHDTHKGQYDAACGPNVQASSLGAFTRRHSASARL